jgi:hypothetical protein
VASTVGAAKHAHTNLGRASQNRIRFEILVIHAQILRTRRVERRQYTGDGRIG